MNESLTKTKKIKILKKTKNSISDSQHNFADIEDNSDNINEIEEEEVVDYSQLSVINVIFKDKVKEISNDSMEKVNTYQPSTSKVHDYDRVIAEDSQTDSDNDEEDVPIKTIIPRAVVDQVYEET